MYDKALTAISNENIGELATLLLQQGSQLSIEQMDLLFLAAINKQSKPALTFLLTFDPFPPKSERLGKFAKAISEINYFEGLDPIYRKYPDFVSSVQLLAANSKNEKLLFWVLSKVDVDTFYKNWINIQPQIWPWYFEYCLSVITDIPKLSSILKIILENDQNPLGDLSFLINKLLDMGADPNYLLQDGETALHCAVRRKREPDLIFQLLCRGANPALSCSQGNALEMAKAYNFDALVTAFESYANIQPFINAVNSGPVPLIEHTFAAALLQSYLELADKRIYEKQHAEQLKRIFTRSDSTVKDIIATYRASNSINTETLRNLLDFISGPYFDSMLQRRQVVSASKTPHIAAIPPKKLSLNKAFFENIQNGDLNKFCIDIASIYLDFISFKALLRTSMDTQQQDMFYILLKFYPHYFEQYFTEESSSLFPYFVSCNWVFETYLECIGKSAVKSKPLLFFIMEQNDEYVSVLRRLLRKDIQYKMDDSEVSPLLKIKYGKLINTFLFNEFVAPYEDRQYSAEYVRCYDNYFKIIQIVNKARSTKPNNAKEFIIALLKEYIEKRGGNLTSSKDKAESVIAAIQNFNDVEARDYIRLHHCEISMPGTYKCLLAFIETEHFDSMLPGFIDLSSSEKKQDKSISIPSYLQDSLQKLPEKVLAEKFDYELLFKVKEALQVTTLKAWQINALLSQGLSLFNAADLTAGYRFTVGYGYFLAFSGNIEGLDFLKKFHPVIVWPTWLPINPAQAAVSGDKPNVLDWLQNHYPDKLFAERNDLMQTAVKQHSLQSFTWLCLYNFPDLEAAKALLLSTKATNNSQMIDFATNLVEKLQRRERIRGLKTAASYQEQAIICVEDEIRRLHPLITPAVDMESSWSRIKALNALLFILEYATQENLGAQIMQWEIENMSIINMPLRGANQLFLFQFSTTTETTICVQKVKKWLGLPGTVEFSQNNSATTTTTTTTTTSAVSGSPLTETTSKAMLIIEGEITQLSRHLVAKVGMRSSTERIKALRELQGIIKEFAPLSKAELADKISAWESSNAWEINTTLNTTNDGFLKMFGHKKTAPTSTAVCVAKVKEMFGIGAQMNCGL